jgi:hypothetical protein
MRFRSSAWLVGVALVIPCPTALAAPTLPLTRVRFYETGVGYFERSGAIPGGDTALPVPAGHLDDALKTLVVLGGDAKVSGVAFASSVSRDMARKLAGLPEQGDAPLSFSELSRSFKGAGVSVVTKAGTVTGRLVDVLDPGQGELERCKEAVETGKNGGQGDAAGGRPTPCQLIERGSLLVLTTAGELRRIASSDVTSLRPTEPAARARLDAALDALSQRGAQTRRELGVVTSSGGKVTLGYVAEAPVWRSTYRVVLGQDRSKLQGWALLHNDTDESWQSVQVDLVNGRPTSFLYPLAAPRYARRELVTPQDQLYSVPQLFDTTVDNLWSGEEIGGGYGEGIGLGGVGVVGYGAGAGGLGEGLSPESGELDIGNLAALAPAEGLEAAALFRYTLPSKLSLKAHASALVPFLDSAIKVRVVSWFSATADAAASALHVTNDTKQTLPAGTISVFGDGGFAGESLLPRSKPNESHLLSYGVDLDVELKRDTSTPSEEPRLFSFANGELEQHYVRRRAQKLSVKNRSGSARTVYVELDVVNNARVDGATKLGHDPDLGKTYVVLEVPAGKEVTQALKLEEGLRRSTKFTTLTARTLRGFASSKLTSAPQRAILLRAADYFEQAGARQLGQPQRRAELEQALSDVARVRENARILGGVDAERAEAMAERVVQLEAKVSTLRATIARLNRERAELVSAAERELTKL